MAIGDWPLLAAADETQSLALGNVSFFTDGVEIIHNFASGDERVQIGASIYEGDTIRTGKNSHLEIIFGNNVRLRLESDCEIVIHPITTSESEKDEVRTTTCLIPILLRRGTLRARIKENLVNTTIIMLKAGELGFFLPRADFLLRRKPGDPSPQKMLECLLAWGKVEVRYNSSPNTPAATGVVNTDFLNYQPGQTLVSEMPPDNTPPFWHPLTYQQAKKLIQQHAPFSVDREPDLPLEIPHENPELHGA